MSERSPRSASPISVRAHAMGLRAVISSSRDIGLLSGLLHKKQYRDADDVGDAQPGNGYAKPSIVHEQAGHQEPQWLCEEAEQEVETKCRVSVLIRSGVSHDLLRERTS